MRITKYKTELNENLHNILVKESSVNYPGKNICNSEMAYQILTDVFHLNKQAEEYLYMIALNTKGKILGVFEVSHGTVDMTVLNPRDIFIKALLCGASSFILAHNHPSGDSSPSKDDMHSYFRILESSKMLGISLLDNIIIGADSYFSFNDGKVA